MSIPKIIHYCWFGDKKINSSVSQCLDTWHRMCPEYEIVCWNEINSKLDDCLYAVQAYESKKWAFVSDYVRLKALRTCGGIYLDTDVEVLKSFNDLLEYSGFIGFESKQYLATCVIGGEKEHPFFCAAEQLYNHMNFCSEDGQCDCTTNVQILTEFLVDKGLIGNGQRQSVMEMEIFPSDYFSPKNLLTGKLIITENTYSIHHFRGSWQTASQRRNTRIAQMLGPNLTEFLKKVIGRTD